MRPCYYCLSCVTFSESSSLKLITKQAFFESGVCEVSIPGGGEGLCDERFCHSKNLSRVTFGEYSSWKLIGKQALRKSIEIHIPDGA